MWKLLLLTTVVALISGGWASAAEPLRVLYLTKSAGFPHSVVNREGDAPAYSEKALMEIAKKQGWDLVCSKDASLINAENLKNYDVVVFYTTGDLTTPGTDGTTPMGPNGCAELLDWLKAGGGFVGFHSANDSFHSTGDTVSPYVEMIGGEFETHGNQFKGTLKVVSPGHPAIAHVPDGWSLQEEWYISKNLNKDKMHVLALLDPGKERQRQEKYNQPSYPIIWCRAYGEGRVLYNALGHREDVWDNEIFQQTVVDNITWANGKGALDADPNYSQVVPTTIEESVAAPAKEDEKPKQK